jgi:translation initiation factor 3 subunit B
MENVVVVDEIPKVEPARQEKLEMVIKKIFGNAGEIVNVYYPKENGYTKGYCFIEYKTAAQAEEAVKTYSNYRLDKTHTLLVNVFTDFQKYADIPVDWTPPTEEPYKANVDLYSFLTEPDAFDQYCVVVDNGNAPSMVQFWENSLPEPSEIHFKDKFTEQAVKWSPLGTYIVAYHKQGVAIFGGPQFTKINKFAHPGTTLVDFSPKENFIVTYGSAGPSGGTKVIIWDIRTGKFVLQFLSNHNDTNLFF